MSYVNLQGNDRWTEADHVNQVEAFVRSQVPHVREHVVIRRMFQMLLPLLSSMLPPPPPPPATDPFAGVRGALAGLVAQCTPVTPAQFAEILAAAGVFSQADVLAEKARDDSALLVLALDYEDARTSRDALPPSPASDDVETLRQHFQAIMDTADADVRALVMLRDAHRVEVIA